MYTDGLQPSLKDLPCTVGTPPPPASKHKGPSKATSLSSGLQPAACRNGLGVMVPLPWRVHNQVTHTHTHLLRLALCNPMSYAQRHQHLLFWSKKKKGRLGDGAVGTKGQMGPAATQSILSGGWTPGFHTSTSALSEPDSPAGVALCLVTVDLASRA